MSESPVHAPLALPEWSGRLPAGVDGAWPVAVEEPLHGTLAGWKERVADGALRATLAVLARLPDHALARVGRGLARVARRLDTRHAEAGRRFLAQALPERSPDERERLLLASYAHFLDVAVTSHRLSLRAPSARVLDAVDVVADAAASAVLARPGGRVFLTAHLGDWELGSALLPWIGAAPVYVIGKPPKNRFVSERMLATREARGIRVLPRKGAMTAAPAVLAAGGTLALLLDQRTRMKPVLAPFFGRPARCDRSAGVLLKRLRAPVVFGFCLRLPGGPRRYRLELGPVLEPADVAAWSPEQLATRINAEYERRIRAAPEQYFWLHDRYKKTPLVLPGEKKAP